MEQSTSKTSNQLLAFLEKNQNLSSTDFHQVLSNLNSHPKAEFAANFDAEARELVKLLKR